MGARKLSRKGQAEQREAARAERGAMRAGQPQPDYNLQREDLRVQGYPVGPMVRQDIANDQRMNDLRERAAQLQGQRQR